MTPDYEAGTLVRRAPHVLSRELLSEAVLLDSRDGLYFGVNATGETLWSAMGGAVSLGTLRDLVVERFTIAPERAWNDLVAFVGDLERHGLVERVQP